MDGNLYGSWEVELMATDPGNSEPGRRVLRPLQSVDSTGGDWLNLMSSDEIVIGLRRGGANLPEEAL
jgi:hypothetical protein